MSAEDILQTLRMSQALKEVQDERIDELNREEIRKVREIFSLCKGPHVVIQRKTGSYRTGHEFGVGSSFEEVDLKDVLVSLSKPRVSEKSLFYGGDMYFKWIESVYTGPGFLEERKLDKGVSVRNFQYTLKFFSFSHSYSIIVDQDEIDETLNSLFGLERSLNSKEALYELNALACEKAYVPKRKSIVRRSKPRIKFD